MRETHNEATRLEQSIATHKDNIKGYNKAIDHVESHNAEYSRDMTQDVVAAYRKAYGVSDREAGQAVLAGTEDAQKIFRQISSAKADEILQQVRNTGKEFDNSNPAGEFMQQNANAINDKPGSAGGAVDGFARQQGMIGTDAAKQTITESGNNLKKGHDSTFNQSLAGINKAKYETMEEQAKRQANIDEYEANRIGKGLFGTLNNTVDGVGRPASEGQRVNVTRPGADNDFDPESARKLVDTFKPDS